MRRGSRLIVLAPGDRAGLLAAAAARRNLTDTPDVQLLDDEAVPRRIFGLSSEPDPPLPIVINLVPRDSRDALLLPALDTFARRDQKLSWYFGPDEPPSELRALETLIDLRHETAVESWRLICKENGDEEFPRLVRAIEAGSGKGASWSDVLLALETSWDWSHIYRTLTQLARLEEPNEGDPAWAEQRLEEVSRARAVVAQAEAQELAGATVAVVVEPVIPARIRPDSLRGARPDVDALAFVAGPGRISFVAVQAPDLNFLRSFELADCVQVGTVSGRRADLAWNLRNPPPPIARLLEALALRAIGDLPATGPVGRIAHDNDERVAKGLHPEALEDSDWTSIRAAVSPTRGS